MVKGEQNHRRTIDANGSRGKKPSYPIAPKKWPLFTSKAIHLVMTSCQPLSTLHNMFILEIFCVALIHEIFISQKQELDLHRFVKTKYTTEYKIYHRVKFIKLSLQFDIVKGHRCARLKANIRLGAGRKYALVPNKALSIGPWGVIIKAHNLCHDNSQLIVIAINRNHSASKIIAINRD